MEGFAYLAVVIDLYSRRVVGWSMQSRQTTDVVLQALHMAVWRRKPKQRVLIHSDQGSQGGLNRSLQHQTNWRLRWGSEGKVQIDVGDRRYGPLAALVPRRVMNVSRSGFISRED